jgi:hypothetical protein
MATTALDICNLALARIGSSKTVADITGTSNSNEEALCKLLYPLARDYVLREAPWNFALKTASLAGSTTGPQLWAYQYDYPSDCIRVVKVLGGTSPRVDEPQPFEVFNSGSARKIATNQASAYAQYIMQVTDPAIFDPQFISALAMYLGAELSVALSQSPDTSEKIRAAYQQLKASFPAESEPRASVSANASDTLTEVAIANAALLKVGHSRTISSSSEHTNESRLFNIYFPRVRDAILRAAPWNFASKRASLSTASSAAAVANWTYKYTVPSDCLMARFISSGNISTPKFEIIHDATAGRVLYANVSPAVLSYTAQVTDEAQFDPLFTTALVSGLAVAFGSALNVDAKLLQAAQSTYEQSIAQAITQNDKEGVTGPIGGLLASTPTVLNICNMALAKLGRSPLYDVTEPTKEARALSLFYESVQDRVLKALPWNFAQRRAQLVENTNATTPDNWLYVYSYPSDCIQALKIDLPGTRVPRHDQRIPFEVAVETISSADTKLIYCDIPPDTTNLWPVLVYTSRMGTEALFDPLFANAFACLLAAEAGAALGADPNSIRNAYFMYERALSEAGARNLQEGHDGEDPINEFEAVR